MTDQATRSAELLGKVSGMDGQVNIARLPEPRPQYQKELQYCHYLPYGNQLDRDSEVWLAEIKLNLGKAVLLRELRPGSVTWMSRLTSYVGLYGFKFSKKDHLEFIKLAWALLTSEDMEPRLLEVYTRVLLCLLRKRALLSPADLTLDWRPLYTLYEDLSGHHASLNMKVYPHEYEKSLKALIKQCRDYFPPTATEEILAEARPYFCPHDGMMNKAVAYCALFLPTIFMEQAKDAAGAGAGWLRSSAPCYTAWSGELCTFWRSCHNSPAWEGSLLSLLARLAEDNTGLLDWNDEAPLLFHRFMASLGLPVYYKKLGVGLKTPTVGTGTIARWIVNTVTPGSNTLSLLETMMGAINSYYHTTSEGRYSEKLVEFLSKLISNLAVRLHKERYEDVEERGWLPGNPHEACLTEEQVEQFCRALQPALLDLAMSKRYIDPARQCLQTLAAVRPDLFLPPLLARLSSSLETLTEPHKFTAAARCLCSVARTMVRPGPLYPAGPSHVVDILFSVLPGLDCNDMKKTMVVFQLVTVYARLVPLSDLSSHLSRPGLTEAQRITCQQSSRFKEFVLQFMERCFSLLENSTAEVTRQEVGSGDQHLSNEENSLNTAIVSCFDSVLHQADTQIQVAAISRLEQYLAGRIFEPKVAGKIASGMIRTCAKIAPERVLNTFLPRVCDVLQSCLAEADLSSDRGLGDEIMFNLVVVGDLLCLPGTHLLPHLPLLEPVIATALTTQNKEAHQTALTVLRHLLHALSHTCLAERSRIVARPSEFPLEDWGEPGDLKQLDIAWWLPGQAEFSQLTRLVDTFLQAQLVRFESFMAGKEDLAKEELYRALKTVSSIIVGCSAVLPAWREEAICQLETKVEHRPREHVVACQSWDYRLAGENTRRQLVRLMSRLVSHLLQHKEDDTRSLNAIIIILKLLVFQHTTSDESFEKHSKNFQQSKSKLELRMLGHQKHIRAILLDRVLLLHEKRQVETTHRSLTATHLVLLRVLVTLATSHYSKVRVQAQSVLSKTLKQFPYSYSAIVDWVLPLLQPDPIISHEMFKGAIYVVLQNQLLVKHNWRLQCRLWPALVTTQHSEKPSIVALVKSVTGYIHSADNWTIRWPELGSEVIAAAQALCPASPSPAEISGSLAELTKLGEENYLRYQELVASLCREVQRPDLHWRHFNTSLTMLCALLRHEVAFPVQAVTIFTNNLIHDNILVRKASLHVIECILKQHKRKHPKVELPHIQSQRKDAMVQNGSVSHSPTQNGVTRAGPGVKTGLEGGLVVQPGERSDNAWLQYSSHNRPRDQEDYDRPRYIHKNVFGFYTWPVDALMYAPSSQQPDLDRSEEEMPEQERIIFRFLKRQENVDKLIGFLCLENKKGHDRFDAERFGMFKAVFRNFGDALLQNFRSHIERLVGEHKESDQRAASELLAAIIRGSKHWPYSKAEPMWGWVVPALRRALAMVSPETQRDWGTCLATCSDSRDPNRLHWLMEAAMEEPIREQGSFIDASRLYMLQGVVAQQRWRVGELLHRLLKFLIEGDFLHHPYHNVRSRLGAVLTNIFALDIEFCGWGNASQSCPDESEFCGRVLPQLSCLAVPGQDEDWERGLRLLQTLARWVASQIASSLGPVRQHLLPLLPLLLQFEGWEQEPVVARDCQTALTCLSRVPHAHALLQPLLSTLAGSCLTATSWRARVASLDFLQAFIFNNFIPLAHTGKGSLQTQVLELVTLGLADSQLEVRVKAAQVLGGLVHCQFVSPTEFPALISGFQATVANSKAAKVSGPAGLASRHGAVLGLCSFVTAFPHTVPPFLPRLLTRLGTLLHDTQPIPATVKKALQSFKRTHQDNWAEHKAAFTEDELSELTDLLVSPSYYA